MGRRVTVKQAIIETGLSEYTIRQGVRQGRFPHIRTGLGCGKILIDIDLLEQYLEREAAASTCPQGEPPNVISYGKIRPIAE